MHAYVLYYKWNKLTSIDVCLFLWLQISIKWIVITKMFMAHISLLSRFDPKWLLIFLVSYFPFAFFLRSLYVTWSFNRHVFLHTYVNIWKLQSFCRSKWITIKVEVCTILLSSFVKKTDQICNIKTKFLESKF